MDILTEKIEKSVKRFQKAMIKKEKNPISSYYLNHGRELLHLAKKFKKEGDVDAANLAGDSGLKFIKKSNRCQKCGSYLEFSLLKDLNSGEIKPRLKRANFCKARWCPGCMSLKYQKDSRKLALITAELAKHYRFIFLTLTLKNCPLNELKENAKLMSESFKRLKESKPFRKAIKGFYRGIEFLGENTFEGEAHPHFHCVLAVNHSYFNDRTYIKKDKWVDMWQKALRIDYEPIIDVRSLKTKNKTLKEIDYNDLAKAALEVTKYSIKPTDYKEKMGNGKLFILFDSQTKGIRKYNSGGVFKEANKELEKLEKDEYEQLKKTHDWIAFERYIRIWDKQKKNYQQK